MSKVYGWIKEPARFIIMTGIFYFAAIGVKAAYFTDTCAWYKFW